ncbi:hypothetical protein BRARA_A01545 [Brassica rapa]|uniref:Uncharacterized protein n=1 Tax=Brassica campestris TaxID=3711 RepID=A0A398ALZ8_BRACM|nr:hypothetical protein BRARA_A01545 [Brassica rapa]
MWSFVFPANSRFSKLEQALLQQQRLRQQQQQQTLQSLSPSQRFQLQQQQLLRQQQGTQQMIPPNLRPYEAGVCARKMMMYLYHLQQRPAENCITYWKKFVAEYFSPHAKQRLCLSQYENAGHHALGMFPQAAPILSWEFCARRHEELLVRRLIAPQVNQLLQVAQKCQTTISESGSEGVSQQDLKSNSNMVLGAGRQLAKFMELQSLNDLGYPKRYIRTLQISEVGKSMKDLMNFTGDHKLGPIEGLKRLLEQTATAKLQIQRMQEMEQLGNSGAMNGSSQAQMALTSGTMNGLTGNNNNNSSNNQTVGRGAMNGSAQAAAALTNYQSMLMRQNAMNNPNSNTCKQDAFSSQKPTPNSNQSPSSSSHQMQQQQRNMLQQNHPHHLQPPHGNNQEQEMSENRPSRNPTASTSSISGGGRVPSRNNSFTAASNNNFHLSKDVSVTELSHGFSDDCFFNNSDIYGSL